MGGGRRDGRSLRLPALTSWPGSKEGDVHVPLTSSFPSFFIQSGHHILGDSVLFSEASLGTPL